MPSIFLNFPDLQSTGPTVALRLASPTKVTKGKIANFGSVELTALIDTGASATVIKAGVPATIGLQPTSNAYVHTASSTNVLCDEFAVSLIFPQGVKIRTTALELPLADQHIDCLIGRDVLAQSVMTYIGPENQVILSF